jgi:hypothetical protein
MGQIEMWAMGRIEMLLQPGQLVQNMCAEAGPPHSGSVYSACALLF